MEFSGLLVPGEDGLGPGTTSRGADAQDLLKCTMIIFTLEHTGQFFTRGNDPVGELDKRSDIDRPALFTALTGSGLEFERTHASATGITKALDRIEAVGCAALLGKPAIDQRVTKLVGQAVCQHAR